MFILNHVKTEISATTLRTRFAFLPSRLTGKHHIPTVTCLLAALALLSGCRTPSVKSARRHFYAGRLETAEERLGKPPREGNRDKILYLMERGTIRQARHDLEGSTADWIRAADLLERSEAYSLSRGAVSMVSTDRALKFRGFPYEQTLLRTMLAHNFLARGEWQSAGVEARNIIEKLENRKGFPDDAFSRYVAGFCLEMNNDREGAALQYRIANNLLEYPHIVERSGRLQTDESSGSQLGAMHTNAVRETIEMVIFAFGGRNPYRDRLSPSKASGKADAHFEFYHRGSYLDRSYQFSDTGMLLEESLKRRETLQTTKDITRFVLKEGIIYKLLKENDALGLLAAVFLYGTEAPDTRRWETLPRSLQVARFEAPHDLEKLTVVYRDGFGMTRHRRTVSAPLSRRGNIYFLFYRDEPPFPRLNQ